MVDLKRQYHRYKSEIDSAIGKVIDSSSFIKGEEVSLFESELSAYLDIKHVIACANGTDALQLALMALKLKPGDEVITSDFTFIATAEVIALLGLKPVLVDPDPGTFNISPENIRKSVSKKTRVILPVHLFGQCADMEEIMDIAGKHNIHLIEDTAQALGADCMFSNGIKRKAGTMGTIGTTSFFPSKNLGCYGDGGALFTNDDDLAATIRSIGNHGMTKRYYHDHIGINSRLDTIQAAILRVKLKYLDTFNRERKMVADTYDRELGSIKELTIPERSSFSSHIFHQYTLKCDPLRRDGLIEYLAAKSIPSMVYYPVPLHRQKAYAYLNLKDDGFESTNMLSDCVISLPVHTEMDDEQLSFICSSIKEYFEK